MRKETKPSYEYIENVYGPENSYKLKSRQLADELGLGAISISQTEAHLIRFLAAQVKPKKIVEIGTLTGLSCQYFLESLASDGKVWTFEKSEDHVQKSQIALKKWIDNHQCQIIVGDAREKIQELSVEGPFDVIFIDGNKAAYYDYWLWAKQHIRKGGIVFIDNVFLSGAVWSVDRSTDTKQKFSDKQVKTVQQMTAEIFSSGDFDAAFVPTEEGLLLATKK